MQCSAQSTLRLYTVPWPVHDRRQPQGPQSLWWSVCLGSAIKTKWLGTRINTISTPPLNKIFFYWISITWSWHWMLIGSKEDSQYINYTPRQDFFSFHFGYCLWSFRSRVFQRSMISSLCHQPFHISQYQHWCRVLFPHWNKRDSILT